MAIARSRSRWPDHGTLGVLQGLQWGCSTPGPRLQPDGMVCVQESFLHPRTFEPTPSVTLLSRVPDIRSASDRVPISPLDSSILLSFERHYFPLFSITPSRRMAPQADPTQGEWTDNEISVALPFDSRGTHNSSQAFSEQLYSSSSRKYNAPISERFSPSKLWTLFKAVSWLVTQGAHCRARVRSNGTSDFPSPGFTLEPAVPLPSSLKLWERNMKWKREPYAAEVRGELVLPTAYILQPMSRKQRPITPQKAMNLFSRLSPRCNRWYHPPWRAARLKCQKSSILTSWNSLIRAPGIWPVSDWAPSDIFRSCIISPLQRDQSQELRTW